MGDEQPVTAGRLASSLSFSPAPLIFAAHGSPWCEVGSRTAVGSSSSLLSPGPPGPSPSRPRNLRLSLVFQVPPKTVSDFRLPGGRRFSSDSRRGAAWLRLCAVLDRGNGYLCG